MAGESTVIAGLRPDIVEKNMLVALYEEPSLLKFIRNKTAVLKKLGERVSVGIIPSLSAVSVSTSDGSYTPAAVTLTAQEVVVDRHIAVPYKRVSFYDSITPFDFERQFGSEIGRALREEMDANAYDQDSSVTDSIGGGAPFTDALVRKARLNLDNKKISKRDRAWFLSPDAHSDLLADLQGSGATNSLEVRGAEIKNGMITKLYGDPVMVSTNVNNDGTNHTNLYLHKDCMAAAIPQNVKFERGNGLSADAIIDILVGHTIYGIDVIRADFGVQVLSSVQV